MKNKKARELIFNKYGGKCAYCGCDLVKGWHVDHIEPIRRLKLLSIGSNGKRNWYAAGSMHPELETEENLNPACASCNINKHSESLEAFRSRIFNFINSLNQYSVQYKIAKRYGLVVENVKPVVFYFEAVEQKQIA